MALQKVSRSLLNTGVADSSDATAITIDSSENVTFAGTLSSGAVVVTGDANPALEVSRGSANTTNFNLKYNTTLTGQLSAANEKFQISAAGSGTEMEFYTNGAKRLEIDTSGKVGIGKTPSTWFLDVDSSGTNVASFDGSNNTGVVINSSSSIADIIGYSNSASSYNALNIRGASGTGLVVDTSNNVGIGTTSPNAKLDILGTTSDQLRLRTAESEEYKIGRNSSTGHLDFYGTQSGYTGYSFGGVNGIRWRINSSGHFAPAQQHTYDIGGTNAEVRNIYAQGISFASTSNASGMTSELLDDYEEGTWTPALTAGTPSYSVQSGRYTKIGNIVRLRCAIKLSGWSNVSGGEVTVTGIPFSSTTGAYDHDWGAVHIASKPHSHIFVCGVDTNNVFFRRQDVTNADYGMVGTQVDADTAIMFTVTYQTSS